MKSEWEEEELSVATTKAPTTATTTADLKYKKAQAHSSAVDSVSEKKKKSKKKKHDKPTSKASKASKATITKSSKKRKRDEMEREIDSSLPKLKKSITTTTTTTGVKEGQLEGLNDGLTQELDDLVSSSSSLSSKTKKSKKQKSSGKKKKKKKTSASLAKPSLKLQYTSKRENLENLLDVETRKMILSYIWEMIHTHWKCTSDKSKAEVVELWDPDHLLPFPFMAEPESGFQSSCDFRGKLKWNIRDPTDKYDIDVYLVHSLGNPLLKRVKMEPGRKAVFITDNCPSYERDPRKPFPRDTIIFRAKTFMYDYPSAHYNVSCIPRSLDDQDIIGVLSKFGKNPSLYPVMFSNDPHILYFFGFQCPKMIETIQPSVTAAETCHYRVIVPI